MEQVLTVKEAAEYLKLHEVVVRNYIRSGKIRASTIGRKYLITETAIKEFLTAMEEQPKAKRSSREIKKKEIPKEQDMFE